MGKSNVDISRFLFYYINMSIVWGKKMNYLTSTEAANKLGITRRMVNLMCQKGDIVGAKKDGNRWFIPADYVGKMGNGKLNTKPLPIGVSDFARAITDYYYIDKTLLIKEILDNMPQVSLFLRPRRFGKTLNMDMLRTFFERSDKDTSEYFKKTFIWREAARYKAHQGKYPVIFFTFKDMKFTSWEEMKTNIKSAVQSEYERFFPNAMKSDLEDGDIAFIEKVRKGTLDEALWPGTLGKLTQILHVKYGVAPMIMIDEYDTPIQQGHFYGFYDEVIGFMRNFLSGGLKDNKHLSMAFLTGILRVAKESIFSGLNNLTVNSVIEDRYSSYFGFTEQEVKKLLKDYGVSEYFGEVKAWYDGYHFGHWDVYNPWSVLSYVSENCISKTYWQSTGSNDIIGEVISTGSTELIDEIRGLLLGQSKSVYIDTAVVYPEVGKNFSSIYSFLLMGGYLTLKSSEALYDGNSIGEVVIPNLEVMHVFEKEILAGSGNIVSSEDAIGFQRALISGDQNRMQELLQAFLMETISYYDAAAEGFYHGLLLGLSAALNRYYEIKSNREAGNGRYDIALIPRHKGEKGFIIEVKALTKIKDNLSDTELYELLEKEAVGALDQIDTNRYDEAFKGISVYKIGTAFYKKACRVVGR